MFAIFWTPLAFLLAQPPYAYSDATIGLFGLVGAAGTLAAGLAGRMSDRGQTGRATAIALALLLLSWLPLGLSAHLVAGAAGRRGGAGPGRAAAARQ